MCHGMVLFQFFYGLYDWWIHSVHVTGVAYAHVFTTTGLLCASFFYASCFCASCFCASFFCETTCDDACRQHA